MASRSQRSPETTSSLRSGRSRGALTEGRKCSWSEPPRRPVVLSREIYHVSRFARVSTPLETASSIPIGADFHRGGGVGAWALYRPGTGENPSFEEEGDLWCTVAVRCLQLIRKRAAFAPPDNRDHRPPQHPRTGPTGLFRRAGIGGRAGVRGDPCRAGLHGPAVGQTAGPPRNSHPRARQCRPAGASDRVVVFRRGGASAPL